MRFKKKNWFSRKFENCPKSSEKKSENFWRIFKKPMKSTVIWVKLWENVEEIPGTFYKIINNIWTSSECRELIENVKKNLSFGKIMKFWKDPSKEKNVTFIFL